VVGACFAIELDGLDGRQKIAPVPVFSLLTFPAGEGKKDAPKASAEPTKEEGIWSILVPSFFPPLSREE
jgi:hypothetical protein